MRGDGSNRSDPRHSPHLPGAHGGGVRARPRNLGAVSRSGEGAGGVALAHPGSAGGRSGRMAAAQARGAGARGEEGVRHAAQRPQRRLHRRLRPRTAARWPAPIATSPGARGIANPITVFVNIEEIAGGHRRATRRGSGRSRSRTRSTRSTGSTTSARTAICSVDALISDNVRDLVALFRGLPNAKASFATKWVNRGLLDYDPRGRTRVRVQPDAARDGEAPGRADLAGGASGSPPSTSFVAAGYEVHLNFSPVICTRDGWRTGRELFRGARRGARRRRRRSSSRRRSSC